MPLYFLFITFRFMAFFFCLNFEMLFGHGDIILTELFNSVYADSFLPYLGSSHPEVHLGLWVFATPQGIFVILPHQGYRIDLALSLEVSISLFSHLPLFLKHGQSIYFLKLFCDDIFWINDLKKSVRICPKSCNDYVKLHGGQWSSHQGSNYQFCVAEGSNSSCNI